MSTNQVIRIPLLLLNSLPKKLFKFKTSKLLVTLVRINSFNGSKISVLTFTNLVYNQHISTINHLLFLHLMTTLENIEVLLKTKAINPFHHKTINNKRKTNKVIIFKILLEFSIKWTSFDKTTDLCQ